MAPGSRWQALNVAYRIMSTSPFILCAILLVTVSGCIPIPPGRLIRTPALTGRIVDSDTHQPVSNAVLQFLDGDHTPNDAPQITTGPDGRFECKRTWNYIAVGYVIPEGSTGTWPPEKPCSVLLRIESPAHKCRILNLQTEFERSRYANRDEFMGDGLLCYDGIFALGDITVTKIRNAQQTGAGQPATRPRSKPEGSDKPQPESEGRSR